MDTVHTATTIIKARLVSVVLEASAFIRDWEEKCDVSRRGSGRTDDDADSSDVTRFPVGHVRSKAAVGLGKQRLRVQLSRLARLQFTDVFHRSTARHTAHV